MNVKQYLASIGRKGGKAKSAAKTAAARKANAARWHNHKPKRVTATPNEEFRNAASEASDSKGNVQ